MAKELFAGQKQDKYRIIIGRDAISKKNLGLLLKQHKKVLIISDNGIPTITVSYTHLRAHETDS